MCVASWSCPPETSITAAYLDRAESGQGSNKTGTLQVHPKKHQVGRGILSAVLAQPQPPHHSAPPEPCPGKKQHACGGRVALSHHTCCLLALTIILSMLCKFKNTLVDNRDHRTLEFGRDHNPLQCNNLLPNMGLRDSCSSDWAILKLCKSHVGSSPIYLAWNINYRIHLACRIACKVRYDQVPQCHQWLHVLDRKFLQVTE